MLEPNTVNIGFDYPANVEHNPALFSSVYKQGYSAVA